MLIHFWNCEEIRNFHSLPVSRLFTQTIQNYLNLFPFQHHKTISLFETLFNTIENKKGGI